jgi:ketosteroid isomerase-like protein
MREVGNSEAEIDAAKNAWLAALRARDVDRLMTLLTDDIVMMHPNGRADIGKAAAREGPALSAIFQKSPEVLRNA